MKKHENEVLNKFQEYPSLVSAEATLIVCFLSLTFLGTVDQLISMRWGSPLIDSSSRWYEFVVQIGLFSRVAVIFIFILLFTNFVFRISQGVNLDFFLLTNQFVLWLPIVLAWFVASFFGAVKGTHIDSSLSAISLLAISTIYVQRKADFSAAILIFARLMISLFAISALIFREKVFAPYELTAGGMFPGIPRFVSFVQHPNTLAFSLVFLIFIELYIGKKFRILFLPIALVLLALTGSRSSMAILILGIALAYAAHLMKARKSKQLKSTKYIIFASTALLIVCLLFVVGLFQNGLNGRFATWEKAIQVINKYPVFGSGPAAIFPDINTVNTNFVAYAHNQFLHSQSEQGIAGSISLFLFILIFIIMVIKSNYNSLMVASCTATIFSFTTENIIRFAEPSFNLQLIVIAASILAAMSQKSKLKNTISAIL